uniref:Cation-transporting P-type ATPase N-terminal domain-containing protein n=1 Tax=Octactis speculum TaxID=3111310 RepID=A0A7S2FWX1_9STRA|mmetsp:Transcript_32781/g.44394  ORF Transcript_32781/g.44394 Transcript_32781/m.44394 type:complete len:1268 (+) Transcript_32781:93-3896(+)
MQHEPAPISIPTEFSKTKEQIDESLNNNKQDDDDESGEKLMEAMKCTDGQLRSRTDGYRHLVPLDDLIRNELSLDFTASEYLSQGMPKDDPRIEEGIGGNALSPAKVKHWLLVFLGHHTGVFNLLLWFGGVLCFIGYSIEVNSADGKDVDPSNLYLGIVLVVVVFLTGIFSWLQEAKASKTMDAVNAMLPPQVIVVRGGEETQIAAKDLIVGDVLLVTTGEKIPCDIRMLSVTNMKVEQASLTGEPDAVLKSVTKTHENPLESDNICFFGTSCCEGNGVGIVVLIGDNTIMGMIAGLAASGKVGDSPIEKEIHRFIMIISGVAVFLGVLFFCIMMTSAANRETPIRPIIFVIGIIVANVPEGLLATVTVSLTLTAKKLFQKGVKVKALESVETLGSTTCICSDKTGTLTQNKMTASHIYVSMAKPGSPDDLYNVSPLANQSPQLPTPQFDLNDPTMDKLMWCSNVVNTSKFTEKSMVECVQERDCVDGNASDFAFLKFAENLMWKRDGKIPNATEKKAQTQRKESPQATVPFGGEVKEIVIPFNSKYKFMVIVAWVHDPVTNRRRPAVLMKGAAERIFQRCGKYAIGDEELPIDDAKVKSFIEAYKRLGSLGERLIGFCMKFLDDEEDGFICREKDQTVGSKQSDTMKTKDGDDFLIVGDPDDANYPLGTQQYDVWEGDIMDAPSIKPMAADAMTWVGLISLIDPPREAVPKSVKLCREAGVKVVMVTGDHPLTAKAIARKVNIIKADAMTVEDYMEAHNLDTKVEAAQHARIADDDECLNKMENAHKRATKSHIEAKVVPGWELKDMSSLEVKMSFMYRDLVFARTSPEQKLKIVNAAQQMGHVVAVTGDGVNDSPALKGADIGCAMGIAGTDVAKEAADMILMTDDFSAIVMGIEEGRLIFDNLKKSIAYTLSSNIPEISPFLMMIIINMPQTLTTILILCVDLGTDMLPAISLAYEKAESDIMSRPPRDAEVDHLVTMKLISFAYLQIGVIQALAGFYSFFCVTYDYGFLMGDLVGANAYYMEWPVDSDKPDYYNSACPCGGGTKVNDAAEEDPIYIRDGELDTDGIDDDDLKSDILDDIDECKSKNLGTDYSDWNDGNVPGLGKFSPGNWPFTWGCQYGAIKPGVKCKHGDKKFTGGAEANPCYKSATAVKHGQTAAFVSIVIVQWADLLICKTRTLSLHQQGMSNSVMILGLFTETLLCLVLCYVPGVEVALGTQPLLAVHWFSSFPFSMFIFFYDEVRKYIIRKHRRFHGSAGWLEKYTYY